MRVSTAITLIMTKVAHVTADMLMTYVQQVVCLDADRMLGKKIKRLQD